MVECHYAKCGPLSGGRGMWHVVPNPEHVRPGNWVHGKCNTFMKLGAETLTTEKPENLCPRCKVYLIRLEEIAAYEQKTPIAFVEAKKERDDGWPEQT
jgi:hypothetical protein